MTNIYSFNYKGLESNLIGTFSHIKCGVEKWEIRFLVYTKDKPKQLSIITYDTEFMVLFDNYVDSANKSNARAETKYKIQKMYAERFGESFAELIYGLLNELMEKELALSELKPMEKPFKTTIATKQTHQL